MLKNVKLQDTKIYVVEYEKALQPWLKMKNFPEEIQFFFQIDKEIVVKYIVAELKKINYNECLFLENNVLTKIDQHYYTPLKNELKTFFHQELADLTTAAYFSEQWISNSMINLHKVKKFAFLQDLHNYYDNEVGLLVASGPSVERDMSFIKKFNGPIFCLPPSVNYLLKNGIRPDFVILGDSNYSNLFHLKAALRQNLNLMADLSCSYSITSHWSGNIIIFNYQIPGMEFFYEKYKIPYIPQGGTVACSALYIMKYLGIQRIILSGQDFAYQDFKLHVKGSGYEQYYLNKINKWKSYFHFFYHLIKDNQWYYLANFIIQDHKLNLYRDWFNKTIDFLGISILKDVKIISQIQKDYLWNENKKIEIREELEELQKKLNHISYTDSVDEFYNKLAEDRNLFNILQSFNYLLFYKIKKNMSDNPAEFFMNIKESVKKINFLI